MKKVGENMKSKTNPHTCKTTEVVLNELLARLDNDKTERAWLHTKDNDLVSLCMDVTLAAGYLVTAPSDAESLKASAEIAAYVWM
jgi:hypothetical protein